MGQSSHLQVRFWGVRGSIPTPERANLGFGGNTACLEVRLANGEVLIFDAGTGIRNLGQALVDDPAVEHRSLRVFLTHYHWDHIQGLPFFAPLYDRRNAITFHGSKMSVGVEAVFGAQMSAPFFPVNFDHLPASKHFVELESSSLELPTATVRWFSMNHPQGAVGYRIDSAGASIVYASDHEFGDQEIDAGIVAAARGADILIHDAQFTPEEYESHRGWGHSTWQAAIDVARAAEVGRLILFHHDPAHDDQTLEAIERQAREELSATDMAREGAVYSA